jgi:hypothetical protein
VASLARVSPFLPMRKESLTLPWLSSWYHCGADTSFCSAMLAPPGAQGQEGGEASGLLAGGGIQGAGARVSEQPTFG